MNNKQIYRGSFPHGNQLAPTTIVVSSMKDFMILSKIGEGAYSDVYKVKRISDGKIYALKKVKMGDLSIKEKENALNEVRILASINHETIIGYKEAFIEEETQCLCIVMDFADDQDLYAKICKHQKEGRQGMPIDEKKIWAIFIQIVRALYVLHQKKILHRDLKSANVFLSKLTHARLGDLNVSKVAKKGLLYTQTGTPYYASPEVWQDKPYDSKSDIWSMGCVLYEMCTLKPPFRASDMNGLFKRVLKGTYNPIDRKLYTSDLAGMVAKLLTVDPKMRPSCQQILQMSIVQDKADEIGIDISVELSTASEINNAGNFGYLAQQSPQTQQQLLLKTIKMPANLSSLKKNLPAAQYHQSIDYESQRSNQKIPKMEIQREKPQKVLKQIKSMKDISVSSNKELSQPVSPSRIAPINVRASQEVPYTNRRSVNDYSIEEPKPVKRSKPVQDLELVYNQKQRVGPPINKGGASLAQLNGVEKVPSKNDLLQQLIQQEVDLRKLQQKNVPPPNLSSVRGVSGSVVNRNNNRINLDSLKLPSLQSPHQAINNLNGVPHQSSDQQIKERGLSVVQKQRLQAQNLQDKERLHANRSAVDVVSLSQAQQQSQQQQYQNAQNLSRVPEEGPHQRMQRNHSNYIYHSSNQNQIVKSSSGYIDEAIPSVHRNGPDHPSDYNRDEKSHKYAIRHNNMSIDSSLQKAQQNAGLKANLINGRMPRGNYESLPGRQVYSVVGMHSNQVNQALFENSTPIQPQARGLDRADSLQSIKNQSGNASLGNAAYNGVPKNNLRRGAYNILRSQGSYESLNQVSTSGTGSVNGGSIQPNRQGPVVATHAIVQSSQRRQQNNLW